MVFKSFLHLWIPFAASLFITRPCDSLKCYNCQAAIPPSGENPCKQAPLQECPLSSKCLSANFTISAKPYSSEVETVTALTCFPDMNGRECDYFIDEVRKRSPGLVQIEYEKCNLCWTNGCNSASRKILSTILFFGTFFTLFLNVFNA